MPRKTTVKKPYPQAEYLLQHKLLRCKNCGQPLTVTCDRSKPSELVEWKGIHWTKTNPQKMWMFPTTSKQNRYCPYCEDRLHPVKFGKES